MEEDKINDAIVNYLSVILTEKAKTEIIGKFGAETYMSINNIAADVANSTIWALDDYEVSHKLSMDFLKEKYPFLSQAARIKIADAAAYFWKSE